MRIVSPIRKLDQFFIKDRLILEKETQLADLHSNDIVLEIGAGFGNLTELLAENARVIAVEKDRRFIPHLKKIKNVDVICNDILRLLKGKRLGKADIQFNKIVSNIPYSISKPLLLELLRHKWESAVLIMQKEFAEKLAHKKLGIIIGDCCDLKIICQISGNKFHPEAVDSSLIVLKQRKLLNEEFLRFLEEVYRHKNKDVKNVIEKYPERLAKKKIQHLTLDELKEIFRL